MYVIPTNSLTIQGVCFSKAHYRDELFLQHQIDIPSAIGHAIPKRKAEFLAGRLAARAACISHCSLSPNTQIGIGPLRAPQWPVGINGSISHCYLPSGEGIALAACGPCNKLIGIDAEVIFSPQLAAETAEQFTDETERALIQSAQTTHDYHVVLTAVFSAKESFFKAVAPTLGYYFDFDTMKLIAIKKESLIFKLVRSLSNTIHKGLLIIINFIVNDDLFVITSLYIDTFM